MNQHLSPLETYILFIGLGILIVKAVSKMDRD